MITVGRKVAKLVKQNTAGLVMARLTSKDGKVEIIPGMWYWIRPSKIPCRLCRSDILKGDKEIQIASNGSRYGLGYDHYHYDCFWTNLNQKKKELEL